MQYLDTVEAEQKHLESSKNESHYISMDNSWIQKS